MQSDSIGLVYIIVYVKSPWWANDLLRKKIYIVHSNIYMTYISFKYKIVNTNPLDIAPLYDFNQTLFIETTQIPQRLRAVDNQAVDKPANIDNIVTPWGCR